MENRKSYIIGSIGLLIGIIGTTFTIYGVVKKNIKDFSIEIVSSNDVIDKDKQIPNLKLIYKEKDLGETNEVLRISEIKITNNGNTEVSSSDFDLKYPTGIRFTESVIVDEPQIIKTSSKYLEDSFVSKVDPQDDSKLLFSSIILEPEEFIVLKILTKYEKRKATKIEGFGKIAGVKKIEVLEKVGNKQSAEDQTAFIKEMMRLMLPLFIIALIYPLIMRFFFRDRNRRKYEEEDKRKDKLKKQFFKTESGLSKEVTEILKKVYPRESWNTELTKLDYLINNPDKLFLYKKQIVDSKTKIDDIAGSEFQGIFSSKNKSSFESLIEKCFTTKLFEEKNNKIVVAPQLIDAVTKLKNYLKYTKATANTIYDRISSYVGDVDI